MAGFITIHRQLMTHWIFQEPEALKFWLALLLEANWEQKKTMFNGSLLTVERGQLVFGRKKYSTKLGISENKLRRYLALLETEQMIHQQKTNKFTLISITNYDSYQEITSKQPANNPQTTTSKQTKQILGEKRKNFVPPTVEQVREYCEKRNNNIDPVRFVDSYSAKGWYIGKNKMKDWEACVRTWEQRAKQDKSSFASNDKPEHFL